MDEFELSGNDRTAASGRLQPFDLLNFKEFEGPLSVKPVIQNLAPETPLANDRYALESRRSSARLLNGLK